jgi:O-succinylbenzoate synthase
MIYQFEFRTYQRQFRQPLVTSHGIWKFREGIILKLTDEIGKVGWGEIATLPWFGSESFVDALAFCEGLRESIADRDIDKIPDVLPACQFGFESAVESLFRAKMQRRKEVRQGENQEVTGLKYSYLLPTGAAALAAWESIWKSGGKTFKWKVGVDLIDNEIEIFEQLVKGLPEGVRLRLDGNGGLSLQETQQWLEVVEGMGIVEFFEQPLPPQQFDLMLELSRDYTTPLALDESVSTVRQLEECYGKGWRGIFVIKVSIAGSPKRLRQFCQESKIDAVVSSVFETQIGREAALQLAEEISHPQRAVGFGVNHWFEEDEDTWLKMLWKNY